LVDVAGALASTRSRLKKRKILIEFLTGLKNEEVSLQAASCLSPRTGR
jgi:hypothetical protein